MSNQRLEIEEKHTDAETTHNIRLWIIVAAILLVIVFLVGFVPRHERTKRIGEDAKERQGQPPTVDVTKVRRSDAKSHLSIPGTITAVVEAPIYARASGYISKRNVDFGDHVHAGALLATIDAPDLDQQVDQARATLLQSESVLGQQQAQLKLASVTWDRYKVLVQRGVASKQEGDTQEATYEVAMANVKAAENSVTASRASLDRLLKLQSYEKVTAPFEGIVTARNVDVGTLISTTGAGQGNASGAATGLAQGGEMFRVAQINRLRVFVSIPESYAAFVQTGQNADVTVTSVPNQKFAGKVTRTTNAVDPATRTLLTEVQIDNREGKLLPGMYGTITFESVRTMPPLVIPSDALIYRSQGTMVATVQDNIVHLVPIKVGRDFGSQLEIVEGLNEGDFVAINPSDVARDGAKVTPHELASQNNARPGAAQPPSGQQNNGQGQQGAGKKNSGQ
ncbi:secretion protein HlyD [Candidatus Koribacter versatilis Ellin345]|uniref:Secretion protein HlyD n=1 Tax=Koribacter versatilis (strain Ellin345) TaxID=204669 RepID=Q1INJ7_KORVE|nr:efflux RND transporter periplasmic adaptor subunit [Candidatus Koribacter versatilis]ABF41553.1 secretion protein HlyD [Candidatus Koribacter versatilis Ellin345]